MDEITAFLTALDVTEPNAPTRCTDWTAHDLLAHLVAGTEEMARLIGLAADGAPPSPTRGFTEREAPWRAVPDAELRAEFLEIGATYLASLDLLPSDVHVPFTGWDMTADELRMHGRSELALHRWDLVGDDDTSAGLLAQPQLIAHAHKVLANMPTLAEARRVPLPGEDLLTIWGRR